MLYDTKLEDLSFTRKNDFTATLVRLGKSEEWGKAALKINPIENWEKYGFGCFEQPWLQVRVSKMLKGKDITVDTVYAELNELKEKLNEVIDFVNSLERKIDNANK
ncbi:MAG: hypothetical protein J6T74_00795 [Clostridia bacterium]|nr:hypothetical protein [Clostridia bacterium]